MEKRLNKSAVIMLALIMIFTQVLSVFAGSIAEPGLANANSDNEARSTIKERFSRDIESPTQRRSNLAEGKLIEEKQVIQSDTDSADVDKSEKSGIVPSQIIVKYKAGTSNAMKSSLNSKVSAVSSKSFNRLGITQLELPRGTNVDSAVDELKDDPNVEYVEPVYVRKAFGLAESKSSSVVESVYCSDQFYTNGWQWGLEALNMEDLWEDVSVEERSQVTIAIIDSGVDIDHDDLKDSIVSGYDFINNDSDADDDCGHGTHVAGIAAAAHDGKGMAGVAGGAKIMPVKVLDENGSGDTVSVINGILYAVNNGADVINLSLGSEDRSIAEEEAINYALGRGVTVVAAAGNDYGDRISYPARYYGVIAVGALDWDGTDYRVADFTNTGLGRYELDICAPGVDILSSIPVELDNPGNRMLAGIGDENKDGYFLADGTSMAAPFVAGMAAMQLAKAPNLNCDAVLDKLQKDAKPFTDSIYSERYRRTITIDSYVLNSGYGDYPPFNFRRAKLVGESADGASYDFTLSFEGSRGSVTDAVYGTFDLIKRDFNYANGFSWTTAPKVVDQIEIEKGKQDGTATFDITEKNKNSVYYVEGVDGYMGSNPVYVIRDNSNSFSEAQEVQFNTVVDAALDFGSDRDYFKFTVEETSHYIIESTGEIDTHGYLYDSKKNLIASNDNSSDYYKYKNFFIDKYANNDELILAPGEYYVEVKGYELGNYGVVVRKPVTVSGRISLPSGTASEDIKLQVTLVTRTWDYRFEKYRYKDVGYYNVTIPTGQSSERYSIMVPGGTEYVVRYLTEYVDTGYIPIGYYGINGTVLSYNNAKVIANGAQNVNLTLIPSTVISNDIGGSISNPMPLLLGAAKTGAIEFGGDVDSYKLNIETDGNYIIGIGTNKTAWNYYWGGDLFGSSGNLIPQDDSIFQEDSIYSFSKDESYEYYLYYLEAGDYYFDVSEFGEFFNSYEYKVIADKASKITGTISLPGGKLAEDYEPVEIIAENSQGMGFFNEYENILEIEQGRNSINYTAIVPASNNYFIGYYYYGGEYIEEGYYSNAGSKPDKASATPVDASSDVNSINMELIPVPEGTDTEDNSPETATQISINTPVAGRIDGSKDVDYFKFEVAQGPGYYNIESQANKSIAIYLYSGKDWILYNEGDESLVTGLLKSGTYYLMIKSKYSYYGDYSFTVKNSHKPTASNVGIAGSANVGSTLIGRYTYSDIDGDAQSGTTFRWLKSDAVNGTYTAITGATAETYALTQNDLGKYIKFEVTPKSDNLPAVGETVVSIAVGPVKSAAENNNGNSGNSGSKGGSGGGGGGSSPGTVSNNSTTTEQTKVGIASIKKETNGKTSVGIKVDKSKVESALTSVGNKSVILDVKTKAKQDNLEVNIPSDIFSRAAEAKKPVVVDSNNVGFTIEPGTFDKKSLNGEVKLEASQLTTDSIPDAMKNKDAASNEVSLVFDFDLSIGGNKVTDFNKPMTITVKFDASKVTDLSKVGVYYYNEKDGRWEYVGGKANPDGTITFTVDHFSKYMAMEYNKTFADIKGHWAKADIELLISKHIARSESETSFAPNMNITRAAFASMIVKALDIKEAGSGKVFSDVPGDAWYKDDIYKAFAAGIIGGVSSADFAPNENITREQMAAMLMRAYEYATGKSLEDIVTTMNVRFTDESSISSWARRNVILANATGLVAGNPDGTYNPKGYTTKAQAVTAIKRLMEKLNK